MSREEKSYSYEELIEIIRILRSENGCPWDREQTHISLIPNLLEESYELIEALQNEDIPLMQEELGDVLMQVLMHAQIAEEKKCFSMKEVVSGVASKLVHRHPHVFKEDKAEIKTSEEVLVNWERIKQEEKNEKTLVESMERVAKTLPSLMRTQKVQKKAIKAQVIEKDAIEQINQTIQQLEGLKEMFLQQENIEDDSEIGKILFGVVNLSTFFDINAEFALTKSLEKFINRFRYIENTTFTED